MLVLGSPHLSSLPETFTPAMLEPLLQRLEAWRPTAIAVENLSGLQCDFMRRNPARYAESVADYCVDPAPAQAATGLDVPSANVEMERLLADWPKAPTAPSDADWPQCSWLRARAARQSSNGCGCPGKSDVPRTA
jgi:hypothetical protein